MGKGDDGYCVSCGDLCAPGGLDERAGRRRWRLCQRCLDAVRRLLWPKAVLT